MFFFLSMNLLGAPAGRQRSPELCSGSRVHWLICTTVAGGKPLKYVEDAWL